MSSVALALHYQNDVLHADGKIALGIAKDMRKRARLIEGATAFLSAARTAHIPIIHVHIRFQPDGSDILQNNALFRGVYESGAMRAGSWGAEAFDGLAPKQGERVVHHARVSAFYGSELEAVLAQHKATKLLIGGIATNSVVEHTARDGADRGYEVVVVEDACATARDDLRDAAFENIALIGQVCRARDILSA